MTTYGVVLDSKKAHLVLIDQDELKAAMEDQKVKDPEKLSTNDRKVFKYEIQAIRYLERYEKSLDILGKIKKERINKDMPCMLCKRRYLVQTFMNEKLSTIRTYKKDWKKGQLFYLYDQTHYIAVELKSIVPNGKNFKYNFKLV